MIGFLGLSATEMGGYGPPSEDSTGNNSFAVNYKLEFDWFPWPVGCWDGRVWTSFRLKYNTHEADPWKSLRIMKKSKNRWKKRKHKIFKIIYMVTLHIKRTSKVFFKLYFFNWSTRNHKQENNTHRSSNRALPVRVSYSSTKLPDFESLENLWEWWKSRKIDFLYFFGTFRC